MAQRVIGLALGYEDLNDHGKLRSDPLRTKLLKIGALVSVIVRRVYLRLGSHYPYEALFRQARANLIRAGPPTGS